MVEIVEDTTKYVWNNSRTIRSIVESFGYRIIDLVGHFELYKDTNLEGHIMFFDTKFVDIYGKVPEFMELAEELEKNGFFVTIRY